MTRYGENFEDEAPTNMHIKRHERRFRFHKLARAIGDMRYKRNHSKESTK